MKTNYKVPDYSLKKLLDESNLFLDWYLPKYFKRGKNKILKIKFNKIFKKLLNNIYYKNKVFVHRDFHISNLMITKKGLGLIDS